MSETSPALALPYIQPSQAQKHVTHNEALRILDAVTQLSVESADLTTPPSDPDEGARYIVATPGQGDWAEQDQAIALRSGGTWEFFAPQPGWRADVIPTGLTLRFDGTAWQNAALPSTLPLLGLNTSADATNRLAVASEATLLTHDGAGHQLKINKDATTDTASLLFQTGWSGRAEMGTTGSDDFTIKVSPDGTQFLTALTVDADTGKVSFPQNGSSREQLSADRTYFVRMDGSDSNTGLSNSAGDAFRSLQHAINRLLSLDCGTYDVTVQVAPGDYSENVSVSGQILGSGTYKIVGDTTDPKQVKTQKIICTQGASLSIEGFELTAANGLTVQSDAKVDVGDLHFSGPGSALSLQQAFINANYANLSFGPAVTTIATMYNYAYLSGFGATFTLETGIDWGASGAFFMQGFCLAWLQSSQFNGDTGSAIGRRYSLSLSSALNTANAGVTFIPGSVAGTTLHNSTYL
ncbi:DUF2793 domain-containing protein [Roseovarius sp. 2305UL8-3]|uniref:DUF2793 domain-containing protein n=1 Tax=Roseovarius conchicola TaxID=3121636 RepID=UPI0035274D94